MKLFKYLFIIICLTFSYTGNKINSAQTGGNMQESIPLATKWLLDVSGESGRAAIKSVFMIVNKKTQSKGTGFLLKTGPIITNEHVIRGCQPSDVYAISPFGEKILFSKISSDVKRDLAILIPKKKLDGGLLLGPKEDLEVGTVVSTWGFPLGYHGPAPLLSVGYLSGYIARLKDEKSQSYIKHLVVNGAFNPGNSGGPLFRADDNKVIGVVVSKHLPMTKFQLSALEALAKGRSGIVFIATDEKGNKIKFVESQLAAELLGHFKKLIQVMIGEAISLSELRAFLKKQGIKEPK